MRWPWRPVGFGDESDDADTLLREQQAWQALRGDDVPPDNTAERRH